jgi:hypothetical protein
MTQYATPTMKLANMKVTKGTYKAIIEFNYNNKNVLTKEMLLFYCDVAAMIDLQLTKKAAHRMSMQEILERCYNIEQYVLNAGAASFETIFVD